MAEDWTREEVEAVVADYLDMLLQERRGEDYNKAEHNKTLRNILTKRTSGSVEFKHQNISAVLRDLNYPWIEGYKPASNYQTLLRDVVEDRLAEFPTLDDVITAQVTAEFQAPNMVGDLLGMWVAAPTPDREAALIYDRATAPRVRVGRKRNYLEMEARNRSLGRSGEELVVRIEQHRLWKAGHKKLSERVELISETKGDGLGYDVLSFEENGRERFVEVKTTQFGKMTPFFASRAEVEVSAELARQFHLYRVFNFQKEAKLFTLPGSLRESCRLEPFTFEAKVG